jgi:hypothetical protein
VHRQRAFIGWETFFFRTLVFGDVLVGVGSDPILISFDGLMCKWLQIHKTGRVSRTSGTDFGARERYLWIGR